MAKYGAIDCWDVSGVTDMSQLFYNLRNFNADISGWDTSRVTEMASMFIVRCYPRVLPSSLQPDTLFPARCVHTALARRLPPPGPQPAPHRVPLLATLGRPRRPSTSP